VSSVPLRDGSRQFADGVAGGEPEAVQIAAGFPAEIGGAPAQVRAAECTHQFLAEIEVACECS
jgi:hypothetical protein